MTEHHLHYWFSFLHQIQFGDLMKFSFKKESSVHMPYMNHVLPRQCKFGWNKNDFSDDGVWLVEHVNIKVFSKLSYIYYILYTQGLLYGFSDIGDGNRFENIFVSR